MSFLPRQIAPTGAGWALCGVLWLAPAAGGEAVADAEADRPPQAPALFATVNGRPISLEDYQLQFKAVARRRFYHGPVSEDRLRAAHAEVTEQLTTRYLLLDEAARRGLQGEVAEVERLLEPYDQHYAEHPSWEQERGKLRARLLEDSCLARLEALVRAVGGATAAEVRAYYDQHAALFTEPERLRLSLILLAVPPHAGPLAWRTAQEEAERIRGRVLGGADFAMQARIHSGDGTAREGGDMGYLHAGMLPASVQGRLDGLATGALSEPIMVLEGVALFRVEDRTPARLQPFNKVADRARVLLQRQRADAAWQSLRERLRDQAEIVVHLGDVPSAATGTTP